jgi:tRNA pseudouridine13 synthase
MKSPYELDEFLGLEYFMSSTPGTGGRLRSQMEDFIVDELWSDYPMANSGGDYTHFTLEKVNLDTIAAVRAIARALRVSSKRFGYAGNKDRRALTRQRVSCWRVEPEALRKIRIPGIVLSNFIKAGERISLGDLIGNAFKIVTRDIEAEAVELEELLRETQEQLSLRGIPNYFGYQRFGVIRPNNHLVGRELIRGNLEGAVRAYLCHPSQGEKEDAREARHYLEDTVDYKGALKRFPRRLNYERAVLHYLHKAPRDFAGALRQLPRKLSMMFVHSCQSYLFNRVLSNLLKEGENLKSRKIPLFGYQSSLSRGKLGEIERHVLEEEGVQLKDFWIKSMPELSSRGSMRDASISTDVKLKTCKDELNPGKHAFVAEFALPKGSYATVVMREFLKAEPLSY